jgi:NADH-quinone oxidoreductase subunit G
MVVDTESPKAHATRKECLEFLLKNHPLDCPICDKAGECDLQDFTYAEGQDAGRTNEPRRELDKRKSLGDTIVLDQERCILCSRCVRFFEEVPKQAQLTVSDLGSRSVIATFMDRPLKGKYQGNIADLCPVGALTLKKFRFQARVWNLVKMASTCGECSRGCSTTVEVLRGADVKRMRPRENEAVNKFWMCDIGRFSFDRHNRSGRLQGAAVREGVQLVPYPVEEALTRLRDELMREKSGAWILSPWLTIEEGERIKAVAERLGHAVCFVSPAPNSEKDDLLHTGDPCPNRRGLSELGIPAAPVAQALEALRGVKSAVLIGERIVELLGAGELAKVDATKTRVHLVDEYALDIPCVLSVYGVANCVERTGTWVNIDGVRGPISAVKAPPVGARSPAKLIDELVRLMPKMEKAR